jgi:predicted DCC family thiol-disulfide oxidoreductase YuxK
MTRENSPPSTIASEKVPPVVLFDGNCNLCNHSVDFVLRHERDQTLRFAPSESAYGRAALSEHGITGPPDGIVLIENGRVYQRSTASLRLCRYLRAPWRWLSLLSVMPVRIRDGIYGWIAAHRYRWFGKSAACRVPTPELQSRFLG